jgi:flagellin-like protein
LTRTKNVRNATKFKRSIKAISPVIATLLMIAIAVVASLVVYAWVSGYIGGTTSTAGKAIQIQSVYRDSTGLLTIYVQNVGQGVVEFKAGESIYVDDNLVRITSALQPLAEGQTATLVTDKVVPENEKVDIKVTTIDGTFMTRTGTIPSTSNTTPTVVPTATPTPTPVPTATPTPTPVPTATPTPTPVPTATPTPTPVPTATKLVFSAGGAQTLTAGVVSPVAIVVQRQDASSNPIASGGAITVTLSSSSSTDTFYSNAGGTTVITSITIPSGSSSSAGFYYKDTFAASPTLTGASSGLTSATTQFTINAAAASKLVYTAVDSSIPDNTMSTVFTVQRQDQYNNPTTSGSITLNLVDNTNSGTFYSDSGGANAITTLAITAGSSSANFYWRTTSTNSPRTLEAQYTGLTTASITVTIT